MANRCFGMCKSTLTRVFLGYSKHPYITGQYFTYKTDLVFSSLVPWPWSFVYSPMHVLKTLLNSIWTFQNCSYWLHLNISWVFHEMIFYISKVMGLYLLYKSRGWGPNCPCLYHNGHAQALFWSLIILKPSSEFHPRIIQLNLRGMGRNVWSQLGLKSGVEMYKERYIRKREDREKRWCHQRCSLSG